MGVLMRNAVTNNYGNRFVNNGLQSFHDLNDLGPVLSRALDLIGVHTVLRDKDLMELLNDDLPELDISNDDMGRILAWGVNTGWDKPHTLRSGIHKVMSDAELDRIGYVWVPNDLMSYIGRDVLIMGTMLNWDHRLGTIADDDPDLLRYVIALQMVPLYRYLWSWYIYEHDHRYEDPKYFMGYNVLNLDFYSWCRERFEDPGLMVAMGSMIRRIDGTKGISWAFQALSRCRNPQELERVLFTVIGTLSYCYQQDRYHQGMNDEVVIGMWDHAYWLGIIDSMRSTISLPLPVLMTNARMGDYHE